MATFVDGLSLRRCPRRKRGAKYNYRMSALFPDTHPKMEALQIELIRRMPPAKKMAIVDGLNETIKTLAISGLKERHPNATAEEIRFLLAELMLGSELARKVYAHAR